MRPKAMKEKKDIVQNWLPRYAGTVLFLYQLKAANAGRLMPKVMISAIGDSLCHWLQLE
jgi:hypothetical protein